MKKSILATFAMTTLLSVSAFADQSLAEAMQRSELLTNAVRAMEQAFAVSCAPAKSVESIAARDAKGRPSEITQVAPCEPSGQLSVTYKYMLTEDDFIVGDLTNIQFQTSK